MSFGWCAPYISFQRPCWLLQLSLSTCNKSRWVCSPPITTSLLTSTDPDTNTHIKKTECGGKIGQRLLLPFSISWAVAKALIWTGSIAFPWFYWILDLSLIRNFGYKWGEGFDLLDPAGVMQQIISTWNRGGYDFVIASQFSIGHCSYNENFVNCTHRRLWSGSKRA